MATQERSRRPRDLQHLVVPFADEGRHLEALVRAAELSPWLAFALGSILAVVTKVGQLVDAWIALSKHRRRARYERLLLYGNLSDDQDATVREFLRTEAR